MAASPGPGFQFARPQAPALGGGNQYPPMASGGASPAPYNSDQSMDPWENLKKLGGGIGSVATAAGGGIGDAATSAWRYLQPTPVDPLGPTTQYPGMFNPGANQALSGAQFQNIGDLQSAASGAVASPAEIQLQKQAGLNAARQYGLASALQGRNPGAAMRSARMGSIATQAATNVDAAALRAQEQQAARSALAQAIAQARQQEQQLYGTDVDYRKAMLDAENKNAAATDTFKGSLMNQGGSGLAGLVSLMSDRRAKKNVKPANMRRLAAAIKGHTFDYKDEANGAGRRVGVMAQDVEKGGPAGKLIIRRQGGKLRLDVGNAIGAALAMAAQALRESRKAA